MRTTSFQKTVLSCIVLLFLITSGLIAQEEIPSISVKPRSGQEGKDVIWVPTPQELVDKMLEMAKVTPSDFLMDLGSGDGRLVITAAKLGANALGVEYDPNLVQISIQKAEKEGVSEKAKFIQADLFETDLSKATVITLFLLTDLNVRLRPDLLKLKPGTRIVSNTFTMREWQADSSITLPEDCDSWCSAHLWIIPANVNGNWRLDNGELTVNQEFQMISGKLNSENSAADISEGRLTGNSIYFKANGAEYRGTVSGNRIQGTRNLNGVSTKWNATRL